MIAAVCLYTALHCPNLGPFRLSKHTEILALKYQFKDFFEGLPKTGNFKCKIPGLLRGMKILQTITFIILIYLLSGTV